MNNNNNNNNKNYMTYNGIKYYAGTVMKVKAECDRREIVTSKLDRVHDDLCFTTENKCYNSNMTLQIFMCERDLVNKIVEIVDGVTEDPALNHNITISKEVRKRRFEECFLGTIWYVVIMCLGLIFTECIVLWIGATVVYYNYLKKNGVV